MKRCAGVMINVSSLPGHYGIGGFGRDTEEFIEEMASMGFTIWQTLPITSLGWGNSPYSGISTFAGNYLYIDLERVPFLSHDEHREAQYNGDIYLTNYEFAKDIKSRCLKLAYSRRDAQMQNDIDCFKESNKEWLIDYAAFMTLKDKFNQKCWCEWEDYKIYSAKIIEDVLRDEYDSVNYYCFEQYLFFNQWENIKVTAHRCGMKIFGDLPIYVCYDSVDVWANTALFMLDKDLQPTKVAGVPPDYFAKDGQLWGNPLYNYKIMAKDNYKWWVKRIVHALSMYDILRIDHFRGLYDYWSVDASEKTAINGKWEKGPREALFKELKKVIPEPNIIAEDLGIIDEEVECFVKRTGFYGMRVMQFAFNDDTENKHLPHNYDKECVAYTGTHDNDTTLGYLLSLPANVQENVLRYVNCELGQGWASGGGQCRATKAFIRMLIASSAEVAIIPMQDLCGYGSDTRMNIPGQAENCWRYRTNYGAINNIDRDFVRTIIGMYGR